MSTGFRHTFRGLFTPEVCNNVEVPIIQRDFAQGRTSAQTIRQQFLEALHEALSLPEGSPKLPLDLDFVYGSRTPELSFCPLDGQQRLTTLFLLHWYLACRDQQFLDFQGFMKKGRTSRFTYRVRPSATEFFNCLVSHSVDLDRLLPGVDAETQLSRTLSDSPWFFLSWNQDPTIQSCLQMLDSIHMRFSASSGYYSRLSRVENPYISFHFLNLHDFGLNDELYIKMNARGKPLTLFESFKARLDQWIGKELPENGYMLEGSPVGLRDYFGHRVDGAWTDFLWAQGEGGEGSLDERFMNFTRAVAVLMAPVADSPTDTAGVNRRLDTLLDGKETLSFFLLDKLSVINKQFVHMWIDLLDSLYVDRNSSLANGIANTYYDSRGTLLIVLDRPTDLQYSNWVQFCAWSVYLARRPDTNQPGEFFEWVRLFSNLARNTIYNRVDEFRSAITAVHQLFEAIYSKGASVQEFLASAQSPFGGFNNQQVREERLKAQLCVRCPSWRPLILSAEAHGYFKGQIEFLLKFSGVLDAWLPQEACSWDDAQDQRFREAFAEYFRKAACVFGEKGLNPFPKFLWERALLCMGDYLLPKGRNRSFLEATDRTASWKRLLRSSDRLADTEEAGVETKREMIKRLLDLLDPGDVPASLQRVVANHVWTGSGRDEEWRRLFVESPVLIAHCGERQFRMESQDRIFLLSRKQMNGTHYELRTLHLWFTFIVPLRESGRLTPFSETKYEDSTNDTEQPGILIKHTPLGTTLRIRYRDGAFRLELASTSSDGNPRWKTQLESQLGFAEEGSGKQFLAVPASRIHSVMDEVLEMARVLATSPCP